MSRAYCAHLRPLRPAVTVRSRPTPAPSAATMSHEFQVIADTGEDAIVYCPHLGLRGQLSNWPKRWRRLIAIARRTSWQDENACPRRARSTCEEVAANCSACRSHAHRQIAGARHRKARRQRRRRRSVQTTVWMLLVRGDHLGNEVKAGKIEGLQKRFSLRHRGRDHRGHFGCKPGYLGPVGIRCKPVKPLVADRTVAVMSRFHLRRQRGRTTTFSGVNWGRDLPEPDIVADIRNVVRRRPVTRRQGHARDPARHRSRPRVLPRHQVFRRR